ncbi:hypothetical protein ACM66Z_00370 [Sulfurovum sp. ST-21]|uniref:Uncharacterized protein n=1 Tax=Sulfurovum indicum TaxID=2779528 RepID=A0A7M1S3P5_9BACT|nr:hypothetical protein [Sulfurovum indicum]QOR61978.1 hypothetical protein IMZ28_00370 [Sulfurovum indicum]
MDKSFMVFIAVGMAFFYVVTTYVGEIQEEDERFRNTGYEQEHRYDQYYLEDSIGQKILDVTLAEPATQIEAWNRSRLREEYLELFPDFDTMKAFIQQRVRGEVLVGKLTAQINGVEDKFFSGEMSPEEAKRTLGRLK